jgi:dTDP-4-amino-4,6-dideoxygalactose transaminase
MDEREAGAARRAILSGWVTQGPEVAAFEREFADAVGARYACAVSSCTSALHLALIAFCVEPGDEVVTVSHSFIATANAVRYCGAIPVFVDIQPDTLNIDADLIEAAISPRTKAILCVHQLGMPCDLSAIVPLALSKGLPLIEDAACAAGSEIRWDEQWERIGRPHGEVACFSFHPPALLSTGDGGMLTTANPYLDKRFRMLRQHAMSVPDGAGHASEQVITGTYPVLGYNYRLTDVQAAIGRAQLARLPEMVARRRELAARYAERLEGLPGITTPEEPAWARANWQSYAVRLAPLMDRDGIMQRMLDAGIATGRGVMNAHCEGAYPSGSWRAAPGGLARSEEAARRTLVLPLYHEMTPDEQDRVVAALDRACR